MQDDVSVTVLAVCERAEEHRRREGEGSVSVCCAMLRAEGARLTLRQCEGRVILFPLPLTSDHPLTC